MSHLGFLTPAFVTFLKTFSFCFEAIGKDLILITFTDSLFPRNQDSKHCRSSFKVSFNISKSFDLEYRLVSSAYMETDELFYTYGRSLIYIRNKSGSKHDLCGTPVSINSIFESTPLSLQNCLLFMGYHLNQYCSRFSTP